MTSRIAADQSRRIQNRIAWIVVAAAAAAAAAYDLFQEIGIAGSAAKDAAQPSETNRRSVSVCVLALCRSLIFSMKRKQQQKYATVLPSHPQPEDRVELAVVGKKGADSFPAFGRF